MKVTFFTIVGGDPEEYEFLLGSIEHHAKMGNHLVLDTMIAPYNKTFYNLPNTVKWVYEPIYGHGKVNFRMATAVTRAMNLAKEFDSDILVYLDCDEFFTEDSVNNLFPLAENIMLEIPICHWNKEGYNTIETCYHRRIWPTKTEVTFPPNKPWINCDWYNGNPEDHPVAESSLSKARVDGYFHHHLHYAVGNKSNCIPAMFSERGPMVPWPEPMKLWKEQGILPSSKYELRWDHSPTR